jgi:hypothetical protein
MARTTSPSQAPAELAPPDGERRKRRYGRLEHQNPGEACNYQATVVGSSPVLGQVSS